MTMTVTIRPYTKGKKKGWEVDIMLTIPGRPRIRERRKAPVRSKADAKRWGEERERQLFQHYSNAEPDEDDRPDLVEKEVPTLAAFIPRYLEGHCRASRLRPATIYVRESALRTHLVPAFGRKRLHRIRAEDIQRFKAERSHLKASTINFLLRCLRGILNVAVEWGVIDKPPVRIKMLKEDLPPLELYEERELDLLVLAAERRGHPSALLVVLLGAEAGLRSGEMRALRWADVDLRRKVMRITRSIWRGHEGPTKGRRDRRIPLAPRLASALVEHRHLRDPYVLSTRSHEVLRDWLAELQQEAGVTISGPHILRHTFCSHLAMAGKPVRVIQALAGHASLTTTERYMHLAPGAEREAIEALRRPDDWRNRGEDHGSVIKL